MQSAAVNDMGLTEVSTTYLTGTLTGLVASLVSPGQDTPYRLRRFGVLVGLAAGRQPVRPAGRDRGGRGARPAAGRLVTTLFLASRRPPTGRGPVAADRGSSLPAGGT